MSTTVESTQSALAEKLAQLDIQVSHNLQQGSLAEYVHGNPRVAEFMGHYRVEKTIGQGSYGKVKLGCHKSTGQHVALKVLMKQNIKSAKAFGRVQREIRFLKLMHHPHIVKLMDVIENQDRYVLVMEYASGGELFDYIVSRRRLKDAEARHFFRQMLSAVSYCHQNSLIHRDLKPENLLLDENRQIKIIDFGFSNMFYHDNMMATYCGSPYYAAPEMVLGKTYVGPEVDVWSMGIILYALLCGFLPFDDSNVKRLYDKIVVGTYQCPPHMSPEAKHLLSRMIVVNRRDRATIEEIMKHPWTNQDHDGPPDTFLPERGPVDMDLVTEDVIEQIESFGFDRDKVIDSLTNNVQGPELATYHLMCERAARDAIAAAEERSRRKERNGDMNAIDEDADGELDDMPTESMFRNPSMNQYGQRTNADGHAHDLMAALRKARDDKGPHRAGPSAGPTKHGSESSLKIRGLSPMVEESPSVTTSSEEISRNNKKRGRTISKSEKKTAKKVKESEDAQAVAEVNQGNKRRWSLDTAMASLISAFHRNRRISSSGLDKDTAALAKEVAAKRKAGGDFEIRSVRGAFSVSTTSTLSPPDIIKEVSRVLTSSNIDFAWNGMTVVCVERALTGHQLQNPIQFEIEICSVPNMNIYGLNLKRIAGDTWPYKRLCNRLMLQMRL
eukprot:Clim_evm43s6 gene=Clim_evmTU43s6